MSISDKVLDAKDRFMASPVVEKIAAIRVDTGSFGKWAIVLLLLVGFVVFDRWSVTRTVNAEWRQRIATSSASVRAALAKSTAEIELSDAEIIRILGADDEKLRSAERALSNAGSAVPVAGCAAVPRRCLGAGGL